MRKFKYRAAVAAAALAATLTAAGCAGSGPAESADGLTGVRVGLAIPTMNTALINLAMAADMDEANGLDFQPTMAGAGSTNQISALLAREFEFAGVGTSTAVDAFAEGAPIQIAAGTGSLINNVVLATDVADRLGVGDTAPFAEKIEALRGLTIASSPPGSTSSSTLRYLVEQQGMDPDRDLSIVPVSDPSAIVAGIRRGQFDGSFFGTGIADSNVADGSGKLWLSLPRDNTAEFGDLVGVSMVVNKAYAESNPEVVAAFHKTMADTRELVATDPARAAEILKSDVFETLDPTVFDIAWEQARTGYPAGATFTPTQWDKYKELYGSASENDLDEVSYEDLVAPPARGAGE